MIEGDTQEMGQVLAFPNPDEVGPRRFFIEETRIYTVMAEDEEAALDLFCQMPEDEAEASEVMGGGCEVYAADN